GRVAAAADPPRVGRTERCHRCGCSCCGCTSARRRGRRRPGRTLRCELPRGHVARCRCPTTSRFAFVCGVNVRVRVLILSWKDTAHPLAGGAEVYMTRVAQRLVEKGH